MSLIGSNCAKENYKLNSETHMTQNARDYAYKMN